MTKRECVIGSSGAALPLLFLCLFILYDGKGKSFAAVVGAVGMCVNGRMGEAVGNGVCGLWESPGFSIGP